MGTKRKRKRQQPEARRAPEDGREYLKAAPRALVGREDKPRRMRPEPSDAASVEDPLRDWPED